MLKFKNMESERNFQPKPEKPAVLYHATQSADIERFEPRSIKRRERDDSPMVFATPDKTIAAAFLFPWDDSWVQMGTIEDEPYMVISDEEKFRSLDTGGYIYSLPSDTFDTDMEKGLRSLEYTSGEAVEPIDKEFHSSALEAMIHAGMKVYFVDKQIFDQMQASEDDGKEIISHLTPVSI